MCLAAGLVSRWRLPSTCFCVGNPYFCMKNMAFSDICKLTVNLAYLSRIQNITHNSFTYLLSFPLNHSLRNSHKAHCLYSLKSVSPPQSAAPSVPIANSGSTIQPHLMLCLTFTERKSRPKLTKSKVRFKKLSENK